MRRVNLLFLSCILICTPVYVSAQKAKGSPPQKQIAIAENEVRQFYESYAEDLRQHRREAIAERYDRGGTYFLGNGEKDMDSFESVKSRYMTKWKGPKSFQWKDLSFEMLSPNIAAVLGRFEWETAEGKVFKYSYTGVLVKRDGRWRIRVEDESTSQ